MPIFGGLLLSVFTGIAQFFLMYFTRKVAVIAAAIAVMALLTGALYVALGVLVQLMVWALPQNASILTGIWLFLPDNAAAVISGCLATDAAVALYKLNVDNLKLAAWAT